MKLELAYFYTKLVSMLILGKNDLFQLIIKKHFNSQNSQNSQFTVPLNKPLPPPQITPPHCSACQCLSRQLVSSSGLC